MAAVDEKERRKLNVMEAVVIGCLLGLGGLILAMREELITLRVSQDSTNRTLLGLQAQLADVPALSRAQAELKVRVDRHDEDLAELRQLRGVR